MTFKKWLKSTGAALGIVAMVINSGAVLAATTTNSPALTAQQKIAMLQQKVKYVFVIFHENESFDHFFGTFPGANGLFTAPPGYTPASALGSFTQKYLDTALNQVTISPFLLPQAVQASSGAVVP
ncbi:MAG: hypothetical protein M3N26_00335, partial [Pseudomonadota bacterium]|nr:hypothetical protein [Pseudomonadota bacterium]